MQLLSQNLAGSKLSRMGRGGTVRKVVSQKRARTTRAFGVGDKLSVKVYKAMKREIIEADTVFHIGIARLSRNQMLIRAVSEARCQMERIMYAAIDIHYFGEVPTREHREIMKAIVEHNPDAARRHMHDHIVQSKGK